MVDTVTVVGAALWAARLRQLAQRGVKVRLHDEARTAQPGAPLGRLR